MQSIKKILVPTDFSEQAEPAYEHAQEIAQEFGARIDFIHIIPTLQYFQENLSQMVEPLNLADDIYPHAQEESSDKLNGLLKEHIAEKSRGEAITKIDRNPAERIAAIAEEEEYDLIVMASRGGHGTHLLRGSTTEKVIRFSEVPVFTVDAELSARGLKRILLPTDGSDISFSALPIALRLAATYNADITLCHVLELYGKELEDKQRDPQKTDDANMYESLMDRLENFLIEDGIDNVQLARGEEDFKDQLTITEESSRQSVNLLTTMTRGVSAHGAIADFAAENADVVVMATHGQSGLAHFFLGSTTEKVSKHLEIPVLTVRPHEKKLKEK